ncbi:E3 ubiquitin-protein ligase Topors isoform X2 [Perognathus longimembris pacificus]|uniref:E3 ubiquitin-protein ligase Topors isoform X2 n=1 Tax=Perognathus longimembris pacificus TaxID=214514 RepID=UPI0020197617|nr:E3 ubiquitin-protein ligase Topors isoform X2 [Perognathus longimembris pacificus]
MDPGSEGENGLKVACFWFSGGGSQQPPGSPLSREEGEAPPPAPAPEGRRRSRRVRLRGSCRHRPTFLGHRDVASSASAGPAPASSEIMASATKEFKVDNFSPKAGTSKLQQAVPADASPDSKCPICLDRFDNVSYLDRCLHKFCFRCVQEWSKNKAECPLCKQPFDSIFHSVRAEDDFKEYVLRPSYNGSFATPDRRFRYRTTMTRERNSSIYSPITTTTVNRRTTTPPDSGVLFEGLGISRSRDVEIPHIMRQITIRGPSAADDRTLRKIQEQDIINFRRTLYRAGARVRNIEDGGRYRDISAEFFRRNPACLHRLVPWLKRELTVLFGAHGSLVNIVQHIIMSNVTRYDLESQAFVSDLRPFLLNRTEHFIHEFISFARSPFNMAAFDQHANYDCPAPSYEEGSHSDSSVITISPDETETQELDINVATVSQAPWDDETPGPSYSSSEQVHVAMSSLLNTSDSSDEELVTGGVTSQNQGVQTNDDLHNDSDSSSDNCVIVGFVKPLAERTPELVELSSDSEELGSYDKIETVKSQEQEQSSSSGDSDVSRCSTPRSVLGKDEQMNKGHCDSGTRIRSKKEEKRSASLSSSRDLSSSMRGDRGCSPPNRRHRKRGRSRSSDSRSQSRSGHDQRNHRKHHGKKRMKSKRSRSRESSSRPRGRRDKKSSRTRDSSWSRRSQTLSLSSESTSRSRSHSSDHGKRRSRSRTRDHYYLRNNYGSRYKWEYTYYSRNKDRDGYESSYRRRTMSRAHYSRQSSSPEFRIQSFSERTNARKKNNHSERKYYYYQRHRSRSLSSNRSRTASTGPDRVRNEKPGGKRKYKTRHLESTSEVAQQSHEFTPKVKDSHYQKSSKLDGSYKNESDSLSDGRSSDRETKHKRRKRRTRSLSVEIVYEGKATDIAKHHKKKKKKHKKKHKKHHGDNTRSPVVITIDSDSDKDSEVKANMECDNIPPEPLQREYLASSLESFETKDVVTIEDEFTVLDQECDGSTLTDNLNNANRTVNNIPPQAAAEVEETLDVREENILASDLENQPTDVSVHTEPSRQLPSPRTSLLSVSLGRDCDVS